MAEDKIYTPLLPFNDLIQDGFIIYDNVKYTRDIDLTNDGVSVKQSPNMIKYYTTKALEPVFIGGD